MAGRTPDVDAAFAAAGYRVWLAGRVADVAIGAPCPRRIESWLTGLRRRRGWIVTAHNPGALRCQASDNRRRHARLLEWATHNTLARLETCAYDYWADWPDEPGLLMTGTSRTRIRLIAARLGQLAVVEVARRSRSRLFWISS